MSIKLMTYLNYISNWVDESDENIRALIDELDDFVALDMKQSDAVKAVTDEFTKIKQLASDVAAVTVAKDATDIAATGAAVAALYSFGAGFGAFFILQIGEIIENAVVSALAKDLHERMKDADDNISKNISANTKRFMTNFKKNNPILNLKANGLSNTNCRQIMFQFMTFAKRKHNGSLTIDQFKKEALTARRLFNSDAVNAIYDALDDFVTSPQAQKDIDALIDTIQGWHINDLGMVKFIFAASLMIAAKSMNVHVKKVAERARQRGVEDPDIITEEGMTAMDAVGVFAGFAIAATAVIQIVFTIIDIVNVVEQCEALVHKMNEIQTEYTTFYKNLGESAEKFRKAIAEFK